MQNTRWLLWMALVGCTLLVASSGHYLLGYAGYFALRIIALIHVLLGVSVVWIERLHPLPTLTVLALVIGGWTIFPLVFWGARGFAP